MEFADFAQQYWYYFAALAVVLVLLVTNELNTFKSRKIVLSVTDALRESDDETAVIIDIRTKNEYLAEHVPKAINIEFSELEEKQATLEKYADKKLIIYSASEPRSQQACLQLRNTHENDSVYVMAGGLNAWKDANLPTKRGK